MKYHVTGYRTGFIKAKWKDIYFFNILDLF